MIPLGYGNVNIIMWILPSLIDKVLLGIDLVESKLPSPCNALWSYIRSST